MRRLVSVAVLGLFLTGLFLYSGLRPSSVSYVPPTLQQSIDPSTTPESNEASADSLEGDGALPASAAPFEHLSVLENYSGGYRFLYPSGFSVSSEFGKAEISSPDGKGKVVVYLRDGKPDVLVMDQGVGGDASLRLHQAAALVSDSFSRLALQSIPPQEGSGRFK